MRPCSFYVATLLLLVAEAVLGWYEYDSRLRDFDLWPNYRWTVFGGMFVVATVAYFAFSRKAKATGSSDLNPTSKTEEDHWGFVRGVYLLTHILAHYIALNGDFDEKTTLYTYTGVVFLPWGFELVGFVLTRIRKYCCCCF